MKAILRLNHLSVLALGILLLSIYAFAEKGGDNSYLIPAFCLAVLSVYVVTVFTYRANEERKKAAGDVTFILLAGIVGWELLTSQFGVLNDYLYPSLQDILGQFLNDFPVLIQNLWSSVQLLGDGYLLAALTGIPLGIATAWNDRLERIVRPFANVLSPIPPIVWIPYAIAILPTFFTASVFIIFIGAFWPIFINSLNGAANIDKKYIDSARTLGVNNWVMFRRIVLPAAMPSIFTGLTVGLILSFILLTAAEMIGSSSGIGWYVKMATDYGNYTKVVTGIIFIGMTVTAAMAVLQGLEKHLLRWKRTE